jgi:hypothetical protein
MKESFLIECLESGCIEVNLGCSHAWVEYSDEENLVRNQEHGWFHHRTIDWFHHFWNTWDYQSW